MSRFIHALRALTLVWAVNQILLAMLASLDPTTQQNALQAMQSGVWTLEACVDLDPNGGPGTSMPASACEAQIGPAPKVNIPGFGTVGSAPVTRPPHRGR